MKKFSIFLSIFLLSASVVSATTIPATPRLGDVVTVVATGFCDEGNYTVTQDSTSTVVVSSRSCGSTFTIPAIADTDWVVGDTYIMTNTVTSATDSFVLLAPLTVPEAVTIGVTDLLDEFVAVNSGNLTQILGLAAALIGLFFLLRLVKKWVGRSK